jgi:translation initiation factor IF-3
MDFGKYKYEAAVKARDARKNQTNTVLKEIRFRLKIDKHDYETKRGHALRFLGAGDKVKAMIQFRGREQQRPEMGIRLLQKFADDVAEVGMVESSPRIDGRNMVMVIGPLKNKAEAKAEARRAAQKAEAKAANEAKKDRVDVSSDQAPMTQSLGDLLPEELTKAAAEPTAEETLAEAAPVQEAPKAEAQASATEAPAAEAPPAKVEAPAAEVAPAQTETPAPKPAAKAPAPMPKPMAKPKPAAVKAPAKPAAPKPSGRSSSKS